MKLINEDKKEITEEEKKWNEPSRYLISIEEAEKMNLIPLKNIFISENTFLFEVYIMSKEGHKLKTYENFKTKKDEFVHYSERTSRLLYLRDENTPALNRMDTLNYSIKRYKMDSRNVAFLDDFTTMEDLEELIERKKRFIDDNIRMRNKAEKEYKHDLEIATKLIDF